MKLLGFRDETKGTIFFDIAEIIQRTQPKFVFLENVENLVRHDKGHTFNTIIRILETELGYKVVGAEIDAEGKAIYNPRDFIRNSKNFGMPQNRPRVYIIAFNRKYFGSHLSDLKFSLPTERAAGPVYEDLTDILGKGDVPAKYFLSSGYLETLEKHKARQSSRGYGFGLKIVNDPSIDHPIATALLATGGSGRERNLIIDDKNGEKYAGTEVKGKYSPINSKHISRTSSRRRSSLAFCPRKSTASATSTPIPYGSPPRLAFSARVIGGTRSRIAFNSKFSSGNATA